MVCEKCGHEVVEGATFCPYCGERLAGQLPGDDTPLYLAEVKGLLKSGKLVIYRNRAEFITSSVQKTVFNYSALVSVKKGLDRIIFVTEDGRSESCTVNRKNIHEAFLYIEQAARPYIAQRKERLLAEGIRYSFVSSMGLTGGILNILDDRAEFAAKTGQRETVSFQNVKSVRASMSGLEFSLTDGTSRSFAADKELREEVLAFTEKAIEPYIAERKAALLARGIYFSSLSGCGPDSGTLDILEDRAEFTAQSGQRETVFFKDVRVVSQFPGMLEFALIDGTSRSFAVEADMQSGILAFVQRAIDPYVTARTTGFETAFGIDERIEINEQRGVFHILRQGGSEITEEYRLEDVAGCEWIETSGTGGVLGGVLSGGRAILSSVAGAVGAQGTPDTEEKISSLGALLTIRADGEEHTQSVRFGNFPLGISRTNKKYDRYLAELSAFMDYLGSRCPDCELTMPAPAPALPEAEPVEAIAEAPGAGTAAAESPETAAAAPERDQFGIIKYIQGVSGFISQCATPMTIAIQGSWGSGQNNIMNMLSGRLAERGGGEPVWFHTWQFSQFDVGEQLPILVGNRLIGQLTGTNNPANKDRALKAAKGIIGITSGLISQGNSDGQNLIDIMDALFRDSSAAPLEKIVKAFSDLVHKQAGGRTVIFVDDLGRLPPAKAVELLEAMQNFFVCEGCVFVIAAEYEAILRGARERYGQDFDESKGKQFFNRFFQVSFRVPVSGYNIENYVRDKLEKIDVHTGDEAELSTYVRLIEHSVGRDPTNLDRLFNSFLLLRNMADREMYENRYRRLVLFALLCMQAKFHEIYEFVVRMRGQVTPGFLTGLFGSHWETLGDLQLSDGDQTEFRDFARVFHDIINMDKTDGISESECSAFTEVLDFSSITSQ